MALVDAVKDILAKLSESGTFKYVRVFNNQFQQLEDGTVESFPCPFCLVEMVNPSEYTQLGLGFTASDIIFRIHIGDSELDAQGDSMEQNLSIFAYRNESITTLTYYQPNGCSGLMKVAESQDYQHTNLYHYVIDFKCSFIDSVADKTQGQIIKQAPTDLEVNGDFDYTFLHKP